MKDTILKINCVLFSWYYSRISEHYRQWTFFKSVKILISNYKHQEYCLKSQEELIGKLLEIDRKTQAELHDLRIQQIATPAQIRWANEKLGMKLTEPNDN
jgi:TATA-box binding protein (TBP) (component of TFIID and TFIIIB)